MTKLTVQHYNSEQVYPEELSVDEGVPSDTNKVIMSYPTKDPRLQIITLYNRIQILKDVSSELLTELKQCRKSFNDASVVVGELNGNIKKFQQ
jgi:hypothetical protein